MKPIYTITATVTGTLNPKPEEGCTGFREGLYVSFSEFGVLFFGSRVGLGLSSIGF